jgi:ABC-type multidrug transport system fused ATPase/permease subunit
MKNKKKLQKLYDLFKKFRKEQIFVFTLIVLQIFLSALITFRIKDLIDEITIGQSWEKIVEISIYLLIFTFFNVVLQITQHYIWHKLRHKAINYLRKKMFESSVEKPVEYFKKSGTGTIISKIMNDVSLVAQTGVIGKPMFYANILNLLIVLVTLFILNINLSIIVLLTIPIYFLSFNYINKKLRSSSKNEREKFGILMKNIQEKLTGIGTIKVFQKEQYAINDFSNNIGNYFNYLKKLLLFNSFGTGVSAFITSFLPIVILLYGGYLVFDNFITVGTLIAFYTFLGRIYEPITNLSDFNLSLQTTIGMSERIFDFLENQETNEEEKINIDSINSIEFRKVFFSYGEETILENFNLNLEKGDRLAIIGESGVGKTTILNLLLKFYKPKKGEILINGINIEEIDKKSYYKKLSILEQEPFLFSNSIKENIVFDKIIDKEKINKIINLCKLDKFVSNLENGLETNIEENGFNISGGEKQRICMARSLIKESDLLLLDEATSAIDEKTEKEFIENLKDYIEDRDTILITVSHKKEILSMCNKLINFDKKKIQVN